MRSSMNVDNNQIKIVVVGDGAVGKTCILLSYKCDMVHDDYTPLILDSFTKDFPTNGKNYVLHIYDTGGQEQYQQTRKLDYHNTDVFLIVFSVVNQQKGEDSFNNALDKWLPELNEFKHEKQPIYILVGNKIDLRHKENENCLQKDAVLKILKQKEIQMEYLECSAVKQIGLKEIFARAVQLKLDQQRNQQQKVEINDKPNGVNQNYCCQIS